MSNALRIKPAEEYVATSSSRFEGQIREEDLRGLHDDLTNCAASLDKEIEQQEKIRTSQQNEISKLSAQISELTDHVEKARLREKELTERVAQWVEYLREEKQKMLSRGSRLNATGTHSATISDDIEYNINMLMHTRQRVDAKVQEIKHRKKEHKNQLKQIKNEMLAMHQELGEWDNKYDEVQSIIRKMEINRQQLQERIKDSQQKETAAKLTCIELDKKLHELAGSGDSNAPQCQEDSSIETTKYHFSMTTTSGSLEGPSIGESLPTSNHVKL